jgi:type VI secretion system FHA domain protein
MILTLEVVGPQAARLGASSRKVFGSRGATLGREPDNDWVLPGPYVSGHHLRIQCLNGQFFLVDTSTNGVFINSPDCRLPKGQPYPLKNGERFFVEAYEIRATIAADDPIGDPFGPTPAVSAPARPAMPIPDDPFGLGAPDQSAEACDSDPIKLLGLESSPPPPRGPRAADLAGGSVIHQSFKAPGVVSTPDPAPSPVPSGLIPDEFDPFAPDYVPTSGGPVPPSRLDSPAPPAAKQAVERLPPGRPPTSGSVPGPQPPPSARGPSVPEAPRNTAAPSQPPAAQRRPAPPVSPRAGAPPAEPAPPARSRSTDPNRGRAPSASDAVGDLDLEALLRGAGIESGTLSPEVAESFGRILRVVVAGLMDLLRARERTKSEFRMQMTTFRPADNNPLKFSANVEDALHNLLVKRNPAYLEPVEAFGDAFQDVRNHQVAMLAGVRAAFESMLAEFDPERLQEEFDRQLKKGSILSVPAKLRYWELYRERFHDTVKEAEAGFRTLFGDAFAKAYEEQFEKLRTLSRRGIGKSDVP